MKALNNYHPKYTKVGYSFRDLGRKVKHIDQSEAYEEDEAVLLINKQDKYTLLSATGCSCWDGDWEGWADLSRAQVKKLGKSWAKDTYGASKILGQWITENL